MKRVYRLLFLGIAIGLMAGCSALTGAIPESQCGDSESEILFFDDFSGDPSCGWSVYDDLGGSVTVANGVLQVSSKEKEQFWWTNPGRDFSDVEISVATEQTSGPDDNAYGVICRYQSPENFYMFLISGDGYYTIGKFQTGSNQIIYLTEDGEYQFSDVINRGAAPNDIRASCVGNELSLTVNGILLATVTDPTFVKGDVGVGVTTFQPGTAVIEFDNLRVLRP